MAAKEWNDPECGEEDSTAQSCDAKFQALPIKTHKQHQHCSTKNEQQHDAMTKCRQRNEQCSPTAVLTIIKTACEKTQTQDGES